MCQRSKRTSGHELTPTNWVMGWPPNALSKFSVCSFSDAIQWLFTLFFFFNNQCKGKGGLECSPPRGLARSPACSLGSTQQPAGLLPVTTCTEAAFLRACSFLLPAPSPRRLLSTALRGTEEKESGLRDLSSPFQPEDLKDKCLCIRQKMQVTEKRSWSEGTWRVSTCPA